ncbi:hypothetical protein [Priestia megaterium]|uniref:hypothetical protein n=1 Tax=Priestia megaterium TaxID=1404 RepID=UPI0030093C2B
MPEKNSIEKAKEGIAEIINHYLEQHYNEGVSATTEAVKWSTSQESGEGEGDLYFILGMLGGNWEFKMKISNDENPAIHPTTSYTDYTLEGVTKVLNKNKNSCGYELVKFVERSHIFRLPKLLNTEYESEEYSDLKNKI